MNENIAKVPYIGAYIELYRYKRIVRLLAALLCVALVLGIISNVLWFNAYRAATEDLKEGVVMKHNLDEYELPRSEWVSLFSEWILDDKARYIMERKLLDKASYNVIADELEMSERQIKNIVNKYMPTVLKHV